MQIIHGIESFPDSLLGGAVSVGKFDGMHIGHSLILHRLKNHANRLLIPSIVMTFDPPPFAVLAPEKQFLPLCTLARKIELLQRENVDALIVLKSSPELLTQSAEKFFFETLKEKLKVKIVVEGGSFTFGRNRGGNSESIQFFCQTAGIEADIVQPMKLGETVISSSEIRRLICEGNVALANELLPEPYQLTGIVVKGEQRGRTLGYPTANVSNVQTIIPRAGVYASLVERGGLQYAATTHIGENITFGQTKPTIETYIHQFDGDLYGKEISVVLISHLRDSIKFDAAASLITQMQKDVERCNEILKHTITAFSIG